MLQPFGASDDSLPTIMEGMERWFSEQGLPFLLKGISTQFAERLERVLPGRYQFAGDRNNYDYVYLTENLIELTGRRFSAKKNHINYFLMHYPGFRYLPLTEELVPACIESAEQWYERRDNGQAGLDSERVAIMEVLNNFTYLQLTGGVIEIYGKIEAFAIGEALNEEMAVIHIEKGNVGIRGLYQMINREFCREAWSHMTYINREEDMGIEGLRRAKKTYNPIKMIAKYDVTKL